jgi:hypothetical protein
MEAVPLRILAVEAEGRMVVVAEAGIPIAKS